MMNEQQAQGLGNPESAPVVNEYVKKHPAVLQRDAAVLGQAELDKANTFKAGQMAGLERGKAEVLNELAIREQAAQRPDPVQQLAEAIMTQQISQEQLASINPELRQAAMRLAQQSMQPQGLGPVPGQDYVV